MGPSKGAGMKPSFNPVGKSLAGRGGITGRQAGSTAAKGGRMMTAQGTVGDQRPMTSIKGAGFQSGSSKTAHPAFDPLNQNRGPAPPLVNKADDSPEERAKQMVREKKKKIKKKNIVSLSLFSLSSLSKLTFICTLFHGTLLFFFCVCVVSSSTGKKSTSSY